VTVIIGVVLIVGVFALLGKFDAGYSGGEYLLGSFWPTWMLAFVTAFATPVSYAPFVNDYSRYISQRRYSDRQVAVANGVGMFVGCWIVMIFGAYAGTMAPLKLGPVGALVDASPTWYVPMVILIGTVGTLAQGALCVYGVGLDTASLIPKLKRPAATLLLGVIGIAVVYLGAFVWDALALILAFVVILTILTAPFMVINLMGLLHRRGWYDPHDLQVFNRGEKGGRYWFTGGLNWRAVGAWIPAVIVGVLMAHTSEYTGPWAGWANGVDISVPTSMVIGGVLYALLLKLYPEPAEVRQPGVIAGAGSSGSTGGSLATAAGDGTP
jgi:purine-cytosine permease-like protein